MTDHIPADLHPDDVALARDFVDEYRDSAYAPDRTVAVARVLATLLPAPTPPPAQPGDVIESADDPRIDALPVGSVLSDCDGETIAKRAEAWAGIGYIPIASERDEFGPWTVRRVGWEDDQ